MLQRHKPLVIASACLAIVLAIFYFPYLLGQWTFFYKDCTHFFEPLCKFIGDALARGHLPLWNPYSYCGMAQAAIPSPSIFFPLTWLFAMMSFSQALAVIMIVSQLVCFAGMFLLVELLGWGTVPALIAAAVVSLSGYMFSLSSNYTLVATAAWVPLVFYCSWRCLKTPRFWWILANALVVFMMVSAGRPELSVPTMLMVALFGATFKGQAVPEANRLQQHLNFFKSLMIGLLLAMPTVMPAMEWIPLSRRAMGLQPQEILIYSSNWYDLLSMFIIHPLDDFQLRNSPVANLISGSEMVPYFDSAFVGAIILALALIGLLKRGRGLYWCTVALLVISTILALGKNLPYMSQIVAYLPGASFLRFPSKLLFFSVFCLSLLAARGARVYIKGEAPLIPHMVGWLLLLLFTAYLFLSGQPILPFVARSGSEGLVAQVFVALRTASQAGVALIALLFMWYMGRRSKQAMALNIVAVVAVGTLLVNALVSCRLAAPADYFKQRTFLLTAVNMPTGPDAEFRATPIALEKFTTPPYIDIGGRLQSTINDFQYSRQSLKAFTNIDFDVPSQFGFEGSMVGDYHYFFLNMYDLSSQAVHERSAGITPAPTDDLPLYRFLQIGSTKYVVTQVMRQIGVGQANEIPSMDAAYFTSVFRSKEKNMQVYEVKNPLPRAYLAASVHAFDQRDDIIQTMVDCRNNGFDPCKETLVEKENDKSGALQTIARDDAITPVAMASTQPEVVICDVKAVHQSLLVLQDQYYPGWRVEVDGQATELLRCNGFMRGVIVSAGAHRVSFIYQPKSVILGFVLALLGAVWCVALYFEERKSKVTEAAADKAAGDA
ncbi:MAG TPA: YfhO family protein [Candidatus Obscuribacterales bacterium]